MDNLTKLENLARMIIEAGATNRNPSEIDIINAINKASTCFGDEISKEDVSTVERRLQSSLKIQMDLGRSVINNETYHPWLLSRKSNIDPYYWNRYTKYLATTQGWSANVIDKLGEVSDDILDLCGNPTSEGGWKRKGLIIGDIQSGKTSNYLALCNKGADAGYKIIILLSGLLESLRKQTQERVDEGFVGLNSKDILKKVQKKKYVGVGCITSERSAYQFTSVISDFDSKKLQALNFKISGLSEPVILVLKKNKQILQNLSTWLSTRNTDHIGDKIDLPLLLIDDESDNASVNTNKNDEDLTAINKSICEILKLFNKVTYVAVTATPFANIFIDPELDDEHNDDLNLFPSDFIYALSAPTNYIGARRIFADNAEYSNSLETIDDVDVNVENNEYVFRSKAKSSHIVSSIPLSLKNAIKYFLLVNTIQDIYSNQISHRSMLINVSQFVNVQNQVYEMVKDYLIKFQQKIAHNSKLPYIDAMKCNEIVELYNVWKEYNLSYLSQEQYNLDTPLNWKDVLGRLYEATSKICVKLVNQKSKGIERLDYEQFRETGLRVIAIGGNSLSRGLTLEGLSVSYFDRNSQMYDTLMQMGRWFGYRKDYDKLFKIWMKPAAIGWYEYISNASDELRDEIHEMRRLGLTPKDFGLKVQQNMVSLFVTARTKMRATTLVEKVVSLAVEVVETPRLIANIDSCLNPNYELTKNFLSELESNPYYYEKDYNVDNSGHDFENAIVFTKIEKEKISKFIASFVTHPRHIPFNSSDLSEFINNSQEFSTWSVAVIGGKGDESDLIKRRRIKLAKRVMLTDENCLLISGRRARVGVPGATKFGLKYDQVKELTDKYKKENPEVKTVPDKPYLRIKRDPILLVYLLQIDSDTCINRKVNSDNKSIELLDGACPVVGLGLGFPGEYEGSLNESKRVKYVLNSICEQNLRCYEEEVGDEDE